FALLLAANAILGTALPMMIVLGGLAGLMLAPTPSLATLPTSVSTLAGLFAAAPFSLLMGRYGRQPGFILGALFAAIGGGAGLLALLQGSFILLLAGHFMIGSALACFQFFRFAAAEVVPDRWRSVAISLMLTSGLVAALAGPEIFTRSSDAFSPVPFAGAYAAIVGLAAVGVLPLLFLQGLRRAPETQTAAKSKVDVRAVLRRPTVAVAIITAAVSQGVMVLLMVLFNSKLSAIICGLNYVRQAITMARSLGKQPFNR
ncbi:MAG: MFS transporter, partial [Cyanobacteria bacterium P01_H01_bin.21]